MLESYFDVEPTYLPTYLPPSQRNNEQENVGLAKKPEEKKFLREMI
jgi:hypothetical protein